jgi:alcohol dehydrogenase
MQAVIFDGRQITVNDIPKPEPPPGFALIRVLKAGICGTDLEIVNGYKGFKGVLGHEFCGIVEQSDNSELNGKRVVGEINVSCGHCNFCKNNMARHCSNRQVMGILGLNGCMADYCVLPLLNLHQVPEKITDRQAVMLEPLSAACEILEQVSLQGNEKAVVLGDGRLGILCAWVLAGLLEDVTLVGHHQEKLEKAEWRHLKTVINKFNTSEKADLIVEATGSASGFREAVSLCRPRGTIVLKSTVSSSIRIDLAPVVVNEIAVLGSRCGDFNDGLRMMLTYPDLKIERLIEAEYPLNSAVDAFRHAAETGVLKVVLKMD